MEALQQELQEAQERLKRGIAGATLGGRGGASVVPSSGSGVGEMSVEMDQQRHDRYIFI